MADLETLNAKLDLILSKLDSSPPANRPAWMNPPLPVEQVTIDGKTVNPDGSIWSMNLQKQPEKLAYGYFSAEKDPDLHAKLLALFGKSYLDWYEARDPWAIYKVEIKELVDKGAVNWLTFSWNMQPFSRFVQ